MGLFFRVTGVVDNGTQRNELAVQTEFHSPGNMRSSLGRINETGMHHLTVTANLELQDDSGRVYLRHKQDFAADIEVVPELKDCVKAISAPDLQDRLPARFGSATSKSTRSGPGRGSALRTRRGDAAHSGGPCVPGLRQD